MKKILAVAVIIIMVGAAAFQLHRQKAEADSKAKVTHSNFQSVSTIKVQKQTLSSSFIEVGTITANNVVSVVSQTDGRIVKVYANVGDFVKAGSPLVKIDDELLRSKSLAAGTSLENARKDWVRAQDLHKSEVISDTDFESYRNTLQNAEANYVSAKQNLNRSVVTAPVAGVVSDRPVNLGATISSSTVVATVVDNSMFKVSVNVSEEQAFQVKAGEPVFVTTDVYPGITFDGRIRSISMNSDEAHTIPIEVTIMNSKGHPLKSGIFGKVTFTLASKAGILAVPREALVGGIKTPQVYVVENGVAKLRDIVTGMEYGTQMEVQQGLNEHDQVVVTGQDYLHDNSRVKVVNFQNNAPSFNFRNMNHRGKHHKRR